MPPRLERGFTLLEVLIAVALFALLGLGTYRLLDAVLRSDAAISTQEQHLRELSRTLWTLERDLQQIAPRPIRDGYGDARAALVAQTSLLEFTRAGWRNPTGLRRADLQRVRWQLVDSQLQRLYWVVLDQEVDSSPRIQRVLDNVQSLTWRFQDEKAVWHNEWPPYDRARVIDPNQTAERLPRALEMTLQHVRYGSLTRLLRLTDPAPRQTQPNSHDGQPPSDAGNDP